MDQRKVKGTGRTAVPASEKLALSVPEVAQIVGISTSSVRRLIADGVLPRVPHTERVLVARTAVERWVNQTEGSAA